MNNQIDYQSSKESAQKIYYDIRSIFSPALKEKVNFSADGFGHIAFKKDHSVREESSQILRFKLINRAKILIGLSTTYQEFEETIKEFPAKKYKKKVKVNKKVKYWGIIAIIDNQKN